MRFRKLRIAWSVTCGIVAVLLCVLWVRSYTTIDVWDLPITAKYSIELGSVPRMIVIGWQNSTVNRHLSGPTEEWRSTGKMPQSIFWGGFQKHGPLAAVWMPSWLLVPITAACSIAPWIRWRFSLRTLLIATTLVAVVLGLIVWLG